MAVSPFLLKKEAKSVKAGTGQRDKNDATPPEKIGSHQHNNDVEDGNRDVQRSKSVNYKDYDRECSGNERRSWPVAECRGRGGTIHHRCVLFLHALRSWLS